MACSVVVAEMLLELSGSEGGGCLGCQGARMFGWGRCTVDGCLEGVHLRHFKLWLLPVEALSGSLKTASNKARQSQKVGGV